MEVESKTFIIDSQEMRIRESGSLEYKEVKDLLNTTEIEGYNLDENTVVYFDGVANLRDDPHFSGFVVKSMGSVVFPPSILWGNGVVITSNLKMTVKDVRNLIEW